MSGRVFVWVILGLVATAMPAMAETGTLQGRATLPIQTSGHDATTGEGSFLSTGDAGNFNLQLSGEGQAVRVIHRAFGFVSTQDPSMEVLWSQATERVPLPMHGAKLVLGARLPNFQSYASDGEMQLSNSAASLMVGALAEPKEISETFQRPVSIDLAAQQDAFHASIPAGQFQARANSGELVANGAFKLFVTGAHLAYTGADGQVQDIKAYFRTEDRSGSLYNPVDGEWFGAGTHPEYIQESLQVDATSGHLVAGFSGLAGTMFADHPILQVDGDAQMPAFTGTINVQEKGSNVVHTLHGEALTISGRFTLEPRDLATDATTTNLAGSGDFTTVSYGTVTAHYPWAAITAVGFGAIVLAAVAWTLANGKAILGGGGIVAGYARVQGDEVLEHAGRGEVYERVKAAPGVNFVQLSDQVEFGASTLNYHLRVLERNGYITSVRDGRYLRFFDRRSGHYSGERKNQVSALRNTTSAAMARHIRENPGVPQCDLATKFNVTPSTVTWHMNRLAAAGLINKERDHANTRYYLAQGWANLPPDEQARFVAVPPVAVALTA